MKKYQLNILPQLKLTLAMLWQVGQHRGTGNFQIMVGISHTNYNSLTLSAINKPNKNNKNSPQQ